MVITLRYGIYMVYNYRNLKFELNQRATKSNGTMKKLIFFFSTHRSSEHRQRQQHFPRFQPALHNNFYKNRWLLIYSEQVSCFVLHRTQCYAHSCTFLHIPTDGQRFCEISIHFYLHITCGVTKSAPQCN